MTGRIGQLGIVSGTGLAEVVARRLQDGDPGGHIRRALAHFPFPRMATSVLDGFFISGGKAEDIPYRTLPLLDLQNFLRHFILLSVRGNYSTKNH